MSGSRKKSTSSGSVKELPLEEFHKHLLDALSSQEVIKCIADKMMVQLDLLIEERVEGIRTKIMEDCNKKIKKASSEHQKSLSELNTKFDMIQRENSEMKCELNKLQQAQLNSTIIVKGVDFTSTVAEKCDTNFCPSKEVMSEYLKNRLAVTVSPDDIEAIRVIKPKKPSNTPPVVVRFSPNNSAKAREVLRQRIKLKGKKEY